MQDAVTGSATPGDQRAFIDEGFACVAVSRPTSMVRVEDFDEGYRYDRSHAAYPLGGTPMADVPFGTLHAYMTRRFGPGSIGADAGKDITAGWLLTTPDPDILVKVTPSLSGADFSFAAYALGREDPFPRRDEALRAARQEAVAAAFRATVLDLLRPVSVRDASFNAVGVVEPGSPLLARRGPQGTRHLEAPSHSSSGLPVPLDLFGGAKWGELVSLISEAGGGDLGAGKAAVVDLLSATLVAGLRGRPRPVRMLVAARSVGQRDDAFREGLDLGVDAQAVPALNAVLDGKAALDAIPSLVDDGFGSDDIAAAERVCLALDIRGEIRRPLARARTQRRLAAEYAAMWRLADGEIPDAAIPAASVRGHGMPSDGDLALFAANLRDSGKDRAADWAAGLAADGAEGAWVMRNIVWRLTRNLEAQATEGVDAPSPPPRR